MIRPPGNNFEALSIPCDEGGGRGLDLELRVEILERQVELLLRELVELHQRIDGLEGPRVDGAELTD